jgi:hypothetical protein
MSKMCCMITCQRKERFQIRFLYVERDCRNTVFSSPGPICVLIPEVRFASQMHTPYSSLPHETW